VFFKVIVSWQDIFENQIKEHNSDWVIFVFESSAEMEIEAN